MKTTPLMFSAISALVLGSSALVVAGAVEHPIQAEAKARPAPFTQTKKAGKKLTLVINGKRVQIEDTGKPIKISIEEDGKKVRELNLSRMGDDMNLFDLDESNGLTLRLDKQRMKELEDLGNADAFSLKLDGKELQALKKFHNADGKKFKMDSDQFKALEKLHSLDGMQFKIDADHMKALEKLRSADAFKAEGLAKIYKMDADKLKSFKEVPLDGQLFIAPDAFGGAAQKALESARKSLSAQLKKANDPELKSALQEAVKAMDEAMKEAGPMKVRNFTVPTPSAKGTLAPKAPTAIYKVVPGAKLDGNIKPALKWSTRNSDIDGLVKSLTADQKAKMKANGKLTLSDLTKEQIEMLGVDNTSNAWDVKISIDGTEYRFSNK